MSPIGDSDALDEGSGLWRTMHIEDAVMTDFSAVASSSVSADVIHNSDAAGSTITDSSSNDLRSEPSKPRQLKILKPDRESRARIFTDFSAFLPIRSSTDIERTVTLAAMSDTCTRSDGKINLDNPQNKQDVNDENDSCNQNILGSNRVRFMNRGNTYLGIAKVLPLLLAHIATAPPREE